MDSKADKDLIKALKTADAGEKSLGKIEKALKDGADVNVMFTGESGQNITPLHWAVSNGMPALIDLLLKHKANINAQSSIGYTPLMYAATDLEMAKQLLNKGADPNIAAPKEQEGRTALILAAGGTWVKNAAERQEAVEILKLLVAKGANIHATMSNGWNALDKARNARVKPEIKENDPVVKYLEEQGLKAGKKT